MPQPANIAKAKLREVILGQNGEPSREVNDDKTLEVQFNPQTLKVNFANQMQGGDQRGGSSAQFVARGTTKLAIELWFDVTVPLSDGSMEPNGDVRYLTQKVAYFLTPNPDNNNLPPAARFTWGSFLFEGMVESMDENLEFFSEDGRPLRASVSISIMRQEIQFAFNRDFAGGGPEGQFAQPGTSPRQPARAGDSVQKMAGRAGRPGDWKAIADANLIENPRRLSPGTLIDVNVKASPPRVNIRPRR